MFEQCLYFNTTSLARELERIWTAAFKPLGVTPAQGFMLRVILTQGAPTASELAQTLNISKATCTRTVDGLISLGLVHRVPAAHDARVTELHASERARQQHTALDQASAEVTRRLQAQLGAESFASLVHGLRTVQQSIR